MTDVVLIVPRRADGGRRDTLWEFCRRYWAKEFPDWPIIEGHHADGPFNRSAAINTAADRPWDVAVILDGDVIVDPGQIRTGVETAQRTGRMTLPFTHRRSVNRAGTDAILAGHGLRSWNRWQEDVQDFNVSTAVIVPRPLFDDVGGFDERFSGWGGEDEAFHAVCVAFGGVERVAGDAWHLWHPKADVRTPEHRMAVNLSTRYAQTACPGSDFRTPWTWECADSEPMRRLLAEGRGDEDVVVVVITNGARDTLAKTVRSAEEMLQGPIARRVICDGSKGTHGAIARAHPDWDVVDTGQDPGYALAMRRAQDVAIGSGQPWVFWLEDDFTFPDPVDVAAMQATMVAHPQLAQLALLRQAWYEPELDAGGIIEANLDRFTQQDGFVSHRAFWTSNPMLCRRSLMARHEWPLGQWSEGKFGRLVFGADPNTISGYVGNIGDPPRCIHIGEQRAGNGY